MIWVQIPLDMDFFLLYITVHGLSCTAERLSISVSQQLIMTQTMLTGLKTSKAVMRMPVENKTKGLITATRPFILNYRSFNFVRHYWSFCNFWWMTSRPFKCGVIRWWVTDSVLNSSNQACHISGFRPEITGFFIALPALRLSREHLRRNHKIACICFFFFFRTTF